MDESIRSWNTTSTDGYRSLRGDEVSRLVAQFNTAADWANVRVARDFNAGKVHRCSFYGTVEIGALNEDYMRYGNLTLLTGLYGSHFLNTSLGDNCAVHNLLYCCDQRIGDGVIISNVGEIASGSSALFGMGAVLDINQSRKNRQNAIDIINENGGRAILPCPGMTLTDAYIWARFRDDEEFMRRLTEITNRSNSLLRPEKAIIGDTAVILNTKAIRKTLIGPAAVIDGAELISNSTILSDQDEMTIIGAGAQIRDSIIGYGNVVDSAAQLSSVMTGTAASFTHSARVTHSIVGDNAHIAQCEIANCLIAPSHAQHHNNSFLIASYIGGQSNIAAGATIGSNHNSRAPDGEIWAKRGFWPGLCVSLKHNSRFASFTMIAKGSYQKELDIKYPFSLVAIDDETGAVTVLPAFFFTHNMYAAMRNSQKFADRDNRTHRQQYIEQDILAPDTIDEIFDAIDLIVSKDPRPADIQLMRAENACNVYRMMIRYYCAKTILPWMREKEIKSFNELMRFIDPRHDRSEVWINCASAVISESVLLEIVELIKNGRWVEDMSMEAAEPAKKISTWTDVHALINVKTSTYRAAKVRHAVQALAKLEYVTTKELRTAHFENLLESVPEDCKTIIGLTLSSRAKDFSCLSRTMIYRSKEEMESVLGPFKDAVIERTAKEMDDLKALAETFRH